MIDHLHIKNFLAFPELNVPELKRINLVAGKNGVGKTALLEAFSAYYEYKNGAMTSIARDRKLGPLDDKTTLRKIFNREGKSGKYDQVVMINELSLMLEDDGRHFNILETDFTHDEIVSRQGRPFLFVKAVADDTLISELWDAIKLTPSEDDVLEVVIHSIREDIVRFDILDGEVLVRLKNERQPVNLPTLGSGVKRVLLLALALTKAKNGLLLIDEIETHLHHSVIRKLWKIIFEYAIKWDIQVVATTHSQDAIREFWYEAAEQEEYQKNSQVLRLQIGREGKHEVIQFPFKRLDSVMEMEMEIR